MSDLFEPTAEHDHGCKVLIKIPAAWKVDAEFGGPDNCYRYKLGHVWDDTLPMAMIAMMNPSAAGLRIGDQTVMKTSRIFKRLGFGGQWIANTCAYRHVRPAELLTVTDPVGPRNLAAILEMAEDAQMVVIAHGQLPGGLQRHAEAMCAALRGTGHRLHVLRLSQDGTPMHPLARGKNHIPEATVPVPWP